VKRMTVHSPGPLAIVGVLALVCVALCGSAGVPVAPRTWHVHAVADRSDHHGDDGGSGDGSGRPGTTVNGPAKTLNDVALLAPPPIRPGTAKRTGSTPIVSHAVRSGISKPAPRLIGTRSSVAGTMVNQNGPLTVGVLGTVTINQNGPLTIGPGESWTASAGCPSGQATSGGENNSSSAGVVLNQSYAYGDGSGWIVEVRNQSELSATYTVYAVCTAGLTDYRTVNSSVTVNPGQYGTASVECPEGTTVRGAGVQAGVNVGIGIYHTNPGYPGSGPRGGAYALVNNFDTRIGGITAQAICANGTPLGYEVGGGSDLPPNGYVKSTVPVQQVGDELMNGGGGSPNPQISITYLTDSYPETTSEGKMAWSIWVRNTSNADSGTTVELCAVGN
jgi:hypothetical protein